MRLQRAWYAIRGRAYPRTVGAAREPSWIFYDLALPILGVFRLGARDVMGYTILVFFVLTPVVLLLVTLFGVTLRYPL